MEFIKAPNLHPPWIFPWWGKQTGPTTNKETSVQSSKREKFRHFLSTRLGIRNDLFRRRSTQATHKDCKGESSNLIARQSKLGTSNGSGGYKIVVSVSKQESLGIKVTANALFPVQPENSVATQERPTSKSLADTSENRSLLRKIRLKWLQSPDFGIIQHTGTSSKHLIPQSISFLKEMCPGPSTTEVSCSFRGGLEVL